eukprot:SAG31_NODE_1941_length_6859_cov_3.362278_1_plen_24_part_10
MSWGPRPPMITGDARVEVGEGFCF